MIETSKIHDPIYQYFLNLFINLSQNPKTTIMYDLNNHMMKIGFFQENILVYGLIIHKYPTKIKLQLIHQTDATITLTIEQNKNKNSNIAYNYIFYYQMEGYQYKRTTRRDSKQNEIQRYHSIITPSSIYEESITFQKNIIVGILEDNQKRNYFYKGLTKEEIELREIGNQILAYPNIPISENVYHQLRKTR